MKSKALLFTLCMVQGACGQPHFSPQATSAAQGPLGSSTHALSTDGPEFPPYGSFEPESQAELFARIADRRDGHRFEGMGPKIPIFVITCDRITVLIKTLLSFYKTLETPFEVVIQDNHSTYPPTLEFLHRLEDEGIKVIFSQQDVTRDVGLNAVTQTVAWWYQENDSPYYVVTDPDIELDEGPGNLLTVLATLLEDSPRINVVGPMLHRDDIPESYPFRALAQDQSWFKFQRWHGYFGDVPTTVQDGYIDTVFGMYRKEFKFHNYNYALQTCRPYLSLIHI